MANELPNFNRSPPLKQTSMFCTESVIAELCGLEMDPDDWADAGLPELLKYVYGAKGLIIPEPWKPCFPKSVFVD